MGARLALELARRGEVGATVALNLGGFWEAWERWVFGTSVAFSVRLLRLLEPLVPMLTRRAVGRTLLLAQFSAPVAPYADPDLGELRSFVASRSNAFPTPRIAWFDDSGHLPQRDTPAETVQLLLAATGASSRR